MAASEPQGPILGVDYGGSRIGLAVWDAVGGIRPVGVVRHRSRAEDARRVAAIASERGARSIIVGLPLHADGSESAQAKQVRAFVAVLSRETTIPIHLVDERETSLEAIASLGFTGRPLNEREKQRVDERAAEILLERYLSQQVE